MTNAERTADAILALINSKPRNPTSAEIAAIVERSVSPGEALETSPLAAQIRAAIAAKEAAEEACGKLLGPAQDEAEALYDQRCAELLTLARCIPCPPRSIEHVVLLAELGFCLAIRDRNGRMEELDADNKFMAFAARLTVLQFKEALASPASFARSS
jgi:hypothetical protein